MGAALIFQIIPKFDSIDFPADDPPNPPEDRVENQKMGEEDKKAGSPSTPSSHPSMLVSRNSRSSSSPATVILRPSRLSNPKLYPTSSLAERTAVDSTLKSMESQQKRLEALSGYVPSSRGFEVNPTMDYRLPSEDLKKHCPDFLESNFEELTPALPLPKIMASLSLEKKGRASSPLWYITVDELESLSSYMRGRLTLDKVNAAINGMASYADAKSQLVLCPKKKVDESQWEKALELRDISMKEALKGKHFFLESDIKGPSLDNTGKAILTVL
ncbi:hypothetical protein MLD38_023817 [Melastoma candidum]|uniref:Uncharacterized protein n=1 Tax=Melastoma candidum TaxID=119954 RepID=A0ACB9NQH8_9MYRT|nr:hypothetical protein MLD38_023817 [Melastoma candidum]